MATETKYAELVRKIESRPTTFQFFSGVGIVGALILALLALLQMWFLSGFDASENKDGLQDTIDANQAVISRILEIQERNEARAELDSKNLKILIGDHDHKLDFEEQTDEE